MGNKDNYEKKKQFVEELSLVIEESGKPRISGQIMGWLMVCDPPEQSFNDLIEHLHVSKASISNMTRMLLEAGLIEKVRIAGDRKIHFRIKKAAWVDVLENELKSIHKLRDLSRKGLDLVEDETDFSDTRLKEMNDFYSFAADNVPCLIKGYKEKHFNLSPG